jgi:uncharacterized protein (TIGR02646 family)
VIRVERPPARRVLDRRTRLALAESHRKAKRDLAPGDGRIQTRWSYFRSSRPDEAGDKVFDALSDCFHRKCVYCEQTAPRTIEHFFPKTNYPRKLFRWNNFLLSCRNCNTGRGERLELDASGAPLLLNPTHDEPLDYLGWDPLTGAMVVNPTPGYEERATRTISDMVLYLYDQERLLKLKLVEFLLARALDEDPASSEEAKRRLHDELLPSRPWLGAVREMVLRPKSERHRLLVDAALAKLPEIRVWLSSWLRPPPWAPAAWR